MDGQLMSKKKAYGYFSFVGVFFVFFCKTGRDLAENGNILWTGSYVAVLLAVSLVAGALLGCSVCFLNYWIAARTSGTSPLGDKVICPATLHSDKPQVTGSKNFAPDWLRRFFEASSQKATTRFGIYFGWIALAFLPMYLAFYPGICAYDITLQMEQLAEGMLNEHHPLIHTLLIQWMLTIGTRLFDSAGAGIALYTMLQMVLLAAAYAYALVILWRCGVKWYWQLSVLLYCLCYPFHHYMAVSTTKDVIFSAFFLVFIVTLTMLLRENRNTFKPGFGDAVMFISGVGAVLFRNNGKYAMLVLIVCLMGAVLWGRNHRKLFGRLFMGVVLVFVVGQLLLSVLFSVTDAGQGDRREMLSMPIQQLARCMVYHGGVGVEPADDNTMSDDEKALVRDFLLNESYKNYNPILADPVKTHTNTYVVRYRTAEFIKAYLGLLAQYPGDFINAALAVNAGYLYPGDITHTQVYQSEGIVGEGYVQVLWAEQRLNEWGVYKDSKWPWLHDVMETWADQNAYLKVPVLKYLFVPGTYLWLYFLAAGYLLITRRFRMLLPILLVLGYYATLLLGPTVQLRYLYPLMIALPFVVLVGTEWRAEN